MTGGAFSEALRFAPSNAALLALLVALPALLAFYVRYSIAARNIRPDLSLRKLEALELQRAVLLYEKVAKRLEEIYREGEQVGLTWRARLQGRVQFRQKFGEELADLESYARDLRLRIIRLRSRPIQRYKSWVHVVSSRFAFGHAIAFCSVILAAVVALLLSPEWAPGLGAGVEAFLLWTSLEGRLLFANWMAVSAVAIAAPLLYFARRTKLYREHRPQIRQLREFAATDPDLLIGQPRDEDELIEGWPEASGDLDEERTWFTVLGVSPYATLDDVKQAYKLLVKQNHPDRVHDMAPTFRKLAEAETKKLNVAYTEALAALREE